MDADDVLMPDALWYINHIYTRFPDVHNLHFSTKFYKDSFEWNNYHNTSMVDYKDYESFVEYHKDYELNKSIASLIQVSSLSSIPDFNGNEEIIAINLLNKSKFFKITIPLNKDHKYKHFYYPLSKLAS